MPAISIIVPVYNVEKYLEKCIQSIRKQEFKDIEILLIDDGSTDNSGDICEKFCKLDNRIKTVHKKNGGLSDARNYGLNICSGKYVTFVDSDDTIDKDYLVYLYSIIEKYQVNIAICQHRTILATGRTIESSEERTDSLSSEECMDKILYDRELDISAWAKLYKTTLFKNIQFPVGKLFEDAFTTYKLIMSCDKIGIGMESKYTYMVRKGSIVTSKYTPRKLDLVEACIEMENELKTEYPTLRNALNRKVVYAYISTLNTMLADESVNILEEKNIRKLILTRGKKLIFENKVSLRDKIAIIELLFGLRVYKITWNIYQRLSGRV